MRVEGAGTGRRVRHPFLLQTHNYYALEDRLIIVMELADGSLHDRFQECVEAGQPGIPVEELLRYFSEAAEALDFLHAEKLSHRDIKPQNLLHLKGHAKVADFGISRGQENALDHTMHVGGTPAYMPPEMWYGDVSRHSDQYSLAATWYEMRPASASSRARLGCWKSPSSTCKISPTSRGYQKPNSNCCCGLAKDPDDRFPSCVTFVEALRQTTALPVSTTLSVLPASGRGARVAVASLALAPVVVATALYAVLTQTQPQTPEGRPQAAKAAVGAGDPGRAGSRRIPPDS